MIAPRLNLDPAQFDVTVNGHTITWQLPPGRFGETPQGLADGSVVISVGEPDDGIVEPRHLIVVVRPDGTSVAADFTGISDSANYTWTTVHDAVILLEHSGTTWQVVRYPLPR